MGQLIQKLPFIIELFFNGSFISLYSLWSNSKLPSWLTPEVSKTILQYSVWFVPFVLLFIIVTSYIASEDFEYFIRKHVFSIIIFVPMIITWGDQEFAYWLAFVHLISSVLTLYEGKGHQNVKRTVHETLGVIDRLKIKPAQFVILSFVVLIFIGTLLLKIPVAVKQGQAVSFIDAFFIATSATCVTGLSTVDVYGTFSIFGQIIILILIQVGGLGIMTLQSSMTIMLGRSIAMKDRLVMQELLDVSSLEELISMIMDIVKYTLIIELWGGIILTLAFTFEGYEFGKALYYGFFHSVSAFCNAGFALFDNSLESFSTNPLVHGTISILIILGGLGFIVLKEIKVSFVERRSLVRLSLHAKIVLSTTFILLALGTMMFFFGEFLNALDGYSMWGKLQVSFFQSVTLRTAGFNTIPLSQLHQYTIYLMTLFMFIGACPGSTGGGIKTTTFAILIQSIRSTMKGSKVVEFFDRKIPNFFVVRATAITIISMMIVSLFLFVLMKIETEENFLPFFFEAISAFGTVGLTMGVTPFLSSAGKFTIIILMFIGRVGPLTMLLAIGQKHDEEGAYEYPDGRIMIG